MSQFREVLPKNIKVPIERLLANGSVSKWPATGGTVLGKLAAAVDSAHSAKSTSLSRSCLQITFSFFRKVT
jgi:hypothetical protein